MTRGLRLAGLALVAAMLPSAADAHLVTTGLGPFYDGATHFALSPQAAFPLLALAIYAGLRGSAAARLVLFVAPAAWFVSGMIASSAGMSLSPRSEQIAAAAQFLLCGGVLAANAALPRFFLLALAGGLGVLEGLVSGGSFTETSSAALPLFGMAATGFVFVALVTAAIVPLRRVWAITAMRVVGSWLAALGLLLAGWATKGG